MVLGVPAITVLSDADMCIIPTIILINVLSTPPALLHAPTCLGLQLRTKERCQHRHIACMAEPFRGVLEVVGMQRLVQQEG